MSQAALSHAIKVLEEALEVQLFQRKPKGVALTDAGTLLFNFSKNLLPQLETIENRVKTPSDTFSGRLKIGTHETLAIHLWPEVLEKFQKKYPGVHVSLTSGRIDYLATGLRNQEFHMILSVEPKGHPDFEVEVILENRLAFFAAPPDYSSAYPCLKKKSLTLEEVNTVPILTDIQAHQEQFLPIPRMLIMAGILREQTFELNSFEASIRLASKGLGIALLPERNAMEAVKQKLLREISIQGLPKNFGKYRLCATRLRDCPMESAVSELLNHLKSLKSLN